MQFDVKRCVTCISNNVEYYTLQLFYALWLVNCMQINAIIIHYVYDLRFDWLATCK